MPRRPRCAPPGFIFHVLNRGVGRRTLFSRPTDFDAFERRLLQAQTKFAMRMLTYCIMPNHWHLVLWPHKEDQLSDFAHWLTFTHAQTLRSQEGTIGTGHVYQDRFRSIVVGTDAHFLRLCRYVERNPKRAGLVELASEWPWSGLHARNHPHTLLRPYMSDWPVPRADTWGEVVEQPLTRAELADVRTSIAIGTPLASPAWILEHHRDLVEEDAPPPHPAA